MLPINHILHPTDFSTNSQNAWHLACALARDHGAEVSLVHVNLLPTMAYGEFGAVPPETYDKEVLSNQLGQIEAADRSLTIHRFILEGEPAEEIVRFAKEHECDLIVMGTHGRTGLGRLLMGSVAENVVRRAPCPVLTVKEPMPQAATMTAAEFKPAAANR